MKGYLALYDMPMPGTMQVLNDYFLDKWLFFKEVEESG